MQIKISPKSKYKCWHVYETLHSFLAGLIPVRALIATQLFLACFVSYMLRVNMSLNIIAMVETSTNSENSSFTPSQCVTDKTTPNISFAAAWVALPDVSKQVYCKFN